MFRIAEESLLKRRAQPADMGAAVSAALVDALGGDPPPTGAVAAGRLLADGVVAHAASFGPGREPAYHDQRHQAEATVAMGWLCAKARDLGQLTSEMAAIGVLAMAGHDLLHDGTWPGAGVLEARSAGFAVTLGAQAGLDAETLATIHRVILATDPFRPKAVRDADDLLCRLAQEADVFGSLTPGLGWQLSQALAREADAAGYRYDPPVASFAGRLVLLRRQQHTTQVAKEFGLSDGIESQISAMAAFGDGDAETGACRLDKLPHSQAMADYGAALAVAQE